MRSAVLRARLQEGDAAVERYDISSPTDRRHAIGLLRAVVPGDATAPGGVLWVTVSGPPRPDAHGAWESAAAYLADFRAQLEDAGIDVARLRYLDWADAELPEGEGRALALRRLAEQRGAAGLAFATDLSGRELRELIEFEPK
jgi:nucleotide-binding universal stress UspA family protein